MQAPVAAAVKISPGWKAGVFANGSWYVDGNRNGGFDGPSEGDQVFNFGQAGDIPVTGDWAGSGTAKIGVFRNGQWLLDYNGDGIWDGVSGGDRLYTFGQFGDLPVSGTGRAQASRLGVFRGGFWMLDPTVMVNGTVRLRAIRVCGSATVRICQWSGMGPAGNYPNRAVPTGSLVS